MIYSFIEQPNAIILAVQPATADLATSDALQLAREVVCECVKYFSSFSFQDPTGENFRRTFWLT
jgi:hypothetical protein